MAVAYRCVASASSGRRAALGPSARSSGLAAPSPPLLRLQWLLAGAETRGDLIGAMPTKLGRGFAQSRGSLAVRVSGRGDVGHGFAFQPERDVDLLLVIGAAHELAPPESPTPPEARSAAF